MFAKWKADYQKKHPLESSGFRGVLQADTRKGGQQMWDARRRPEKSLKEGKKIISLAYLGRFTCKHTAAHVRDYDTLRNIHNVSMSSIAVQLNFHPRTYLTADGVATVEEGLGCGLRGQY